MRNHETFCLLTMLLFTIFFNTHFEKSSIIYLKIVPKYEFTKLFAL